jgi:transposase InsO family protein
VAAEAVGVSERTCSKWVARYRAEGAAGLVDRSSAPRSIPHRTPDELVEVIVLLRRLRMTGAEIAFCLAMALSTVSAVLLRVGLGKLSRLDPPEPPNRYQRRRAGELLHIDVKKLGRIRGGAGHRVTGKRRGNPTKTNAAGQRERQVGWEYVHVCVDDATRLAYVEVLGDEKATTAVGFLSRAIAFYAAHGVTVERVMTDNGSAYRSTIHTFACRALGVRHLRTRPYRPRTNGKAERFIRTLLAGWAYGAIYATSRERAAALDGWLWTYNHRRPHGALSHKPPIARLTELNNLAGSYS